MADNDKPAHPAPRNKREAARVVVAVVLLALLVAFVIDNTRYVKVGFVFADHKTRLIYVLVVTAVIGAILDRLWQRARRNH
jgi:uncharacterized integral membrane protein